MSLKPAKIYPFTIGAYETMPLMVQGRYFKILSATGMVDVTGDTFGTVEALQAGQGLRGHPFQRLTLSDRSGAENAVRLMVADEQFVDDRIAGEVSVVDGNKFRSISGSARSWQFNSDGGAGLRPHSQLWNPAGSGRRLVVDRITVSLNLDGAVGWGLTATKLSTTALYPICSMSSPDAAVGVSVPLVQKIAGGGIAFTQMGSVYLKGLTSAPFVFQRPVVVNPGVGMLIYSNIEGGVVLAGALEFFEESLL